MTKPEQWQPMATAPMDGTHIKLLMMSGGQYFATFYFAERFKSNVHSGWVMQRNRENTESLMTIGLDNETPVGWMPAAKEGCQV